MNEWMNEWVNKWMDGWTNTPNKIVFVNWNRAKNKI